MEHLLRYEIFRYFAIMILVLAGEGAWHKPACASNPAVLSSQGQLSIPVVQVQGGMYALTLSFDHADTAVYFYLTGFQPISESPAEGTYAIFSEESVLSIPEMDLTTLGLPDLYKADFRLIPSTAGFLFELVGLEQATDASSFIPPHEAQEESPIPGYLEGSNAPMAERYGNALKACGYQSHNTTPDEWGEVAIMGGDQVCSVWTPAGWNALRLGDGVNILYEDQEGLTTVTVAGGTTWEIMQCDPEGIRSWWIQKIYEGGCLNPQVEWSYDFTADIAGIQIPMSLFSVTCTNDGIQTAGIFQLQVHGALYGCTLRVDGYMAPENEIEGKACTLSQIMNSLKCLEKGQQNFACTKPDCDNAMKAQGYSGGYCNSFDQCVPVE